MTPTAELLDHEITRQVYADAAKRLTGRALSCAINAVRFLEKADRIADVDETVSYFCATHATEEAVACVIAAAKDFGYKAEAKRLSPRDHLVKATVAQFAQMAVALSKGIKLKLYTDEKTAATVV